MLKRIFSKSGLKPNRTFNAKLIKELFGIVAEFLTDYYCI